MGQGQLDLQPLLQAVQELRGELSQNTQTNQATKAASGGKNVVLGSGFVMSLIAAGWGYMQDKAAEDARALLQRQTQQEQVEKLLGALGKTNSQLKKVSDALRQQSIDNVALHRHLVKKLDAVSPRSRRVASKNDVESAYTRAAAARIGPND